MSKTIAITENHRRRISVTLSLLDEMLCSFERWIEGNIAESIMYQEMDTLDREARVALTKQLARMRKDIAHVRDKLQLHPKVRDTGREIASQADAFWENLVELGGKYLNAYGAPSEELVKYLDPKVEKMAEDLRKLATITNDAQRRMAHRKA